MNLLPRFVTNIFKRASFSEADPRDPVVADWFGGRMNTDAGVAVNADTAIGVSTAWACIQLISSLIASLPLNVYRRTDEGRKVADTHPLYMLLHTRPNRYQTSFQWRKMRVAHLLIHGKACDYKVMRADGSIAELLPLPPRQVRPFWVREGEIAYQYTPNDGKTRILLADEVMYSRDLSTDGLDGISPIEAEAQTVGLTLAAEKFGASYFRNGTVMGGVLEHPNQLSDKAYERLKVSFNERHAGAGNAHKPFIAEEGMKWHALGIPPEQAQFLETRKFQVEEVCRIFGVPPFMIGHTEKSTSWGTGLEEQKQGFVDFQLRPRLVAMEQDIKASLLSTTSSRKVYAEHNLEGLLRGNTAARSQFYREMWGIGAITQNQIAERENLPMVEGGDKHYVPLNMYAIEDGLPKSPGSQPVNGDHPDDPPEDDHQEEQSGRSLLPIIVSVADRIASCQRQAFSRPGDPAEFDEKHREFLKRNIGPLAESFNKSVDILVESEMQAIAVGLASASTAEQWVNSLNTDRIAERLCSALGYDHERH